MKALTSTISILVIALGFATAQAETVLVKQVAVGVMDAYIPSGFDSKSDAYVVVNGMFPNSCYSLIEPQVDHKDKNTHEVKTMADVRQSICLRVFVPFTKEISLGKLDAGKHTVRFVSDDGTAFEKNLSVE